MNITYPIEIDLLGRPGSKTVYAVQNDANTRTLEVKLLENGKSWNVPAGVTAALAFRKKDRHQGLYDQLPDGTSAVAVNGDTVSVTLAPQVLSFPGEVKAAVVLSDASLNRLTTFPFTIQVAPNPAAGQALSNDYYNYTTMGEVNEAVDAALASLEEAKQDFLAKAEEALRVVHDTATEDAPGIVCEASGDVIAVADASNRPLQGLSLYGKTTQNGTPTPDAPIDLVSVGESIGVTVAGKNLLPNRATEQTINGVTYTPNADGTVTANGTSTGETVSLLIGTMWLEAGKYILSSGITGGSPQLWLYADGTRIASNQFELTEKHYIECRVYQHPNATYTNTVIKPMIRLASIADDAFEPYKETQTLSASALGGLHGIGEVCDEIDFARGVRVQRVKTIVFDGSESLYKYDNEVNCYFTDGAPLDMAARYCICSHYPGIARYEGIKNQYQSQYLGVSFCGQYIRFIDNVSFPNADAEGMKAFFAQQYEAGTPVTVVYVLKDPIETPLSAQELAAFAALHSNKPNTTIFNDSDADMTVEYVADTKLYIDQKISAISAALLNA